MHLISHECREKGTDTFSSFELSCRCIVIEIPVLLNLGGAVGSVVECLTSDQRVTASSLTGGAVVCPLASFFILPIVLVQPEKCPDMTGKLLTGM